MNKSGHEMPFIGFHSSERALGHFAGTCPKLCGNLPQQDLNSIVLVGALCTFLKWRTFPTIHLPCPLDPFACASYDLKGLGSGGSPPSS